MKNSHIKNEYHSKFRKSLGTISTKSKVTTNQIQSFKNTKAENYIYFHQLYFHMIFLKQLTNDTLTTIILQPSPAKETNEHRTV